MFKGLMGSKFVKDMMKTGSMGVQHGKTRFAEMTTAFNRVGSTLKEDWAALSKSMKAADYSRGASIDELLVGKAARQTDMGSRWAGMKKGFQSFDDSYVQQSKNYNAKGEMHSKYSDYANVAMGIGGTGALGAAGLNWAFGESGQEKARRQLMEARRNYMKSRM